MKYTLLRNATAVLEYGGKRLLIDPALDPAGHRPPVANTANQRPNPLVEMPTGWETVVNYADALLVTHLHQDHFDETAASHLPKSLPILAQPEDVFRLAEHGFQQIVAVESNVSWQGISITRTPAQHGTGEIAMAMAPVSGFVLRSADEPTVYIAGDSIWYEEVASTITREQPDVIIVNASGASFLEGDPIVINAPDIARVHVAAPDATIIVVHLEAINHCHETREYYREGLPTLGVNLDRIRIPNDGETIEFPINA